MNKINYKLLGLANVLITIIYKVANKQKRLEHPIAIHVKEKGFIYQENSGFVKHVIMIFAYIVVMTNRKIENML